MSGSPALTASAGEERSRRRLGLLLLGLAVLTAVLVIVFLTG